MSHMIAFLRQRAKITSGRLIMNDSRPINRFLLMLHDFFSKIFGKKPRSLHAVQKARENHDKSFVSESVVTAGELNTRKLIHQG